MFLDDELLFMCEHAKIPDANSVNFLVRILYVKCEDYYKKRINEKMSPKEVKVILDRTFNLFDSFVRMALKSENTQLKILGKMFEKYTFKKQFLSNKEMKNVYDKL